MNKFTNFIKTINQQLCKLLTIALVLTGVPLELFAAKKTTKTKTSAVQKSAVPGKISPVPATKIIPVSPIIPAHAAIITPPITPANPAAPAKTINPTPTKPVTLVNPTNPKAPVLAPKKLMGLGDTTPPQIISACASFYPNDLISGCIPGGDCSKCTVASSLVFGTDSDFCSVAICLYPQDLAAQQELYTTIKPCVGNFNDCTGPYISNSTENLQNRINEDVCQLISGWAPQVKQILDYWTALQWAQNQLVNMQVEADGTATWQQVLPNSALAINNYYVTRGQITANQCTQDSDCADNTITEYQDCVPVSSSAQNALGVDNSCKGGSVSKNIWGTCNYTGTSCQTDNFCNQQKVCKFPDGKLCNSMADCLPGSQDLFCNKTNSCFNNQCTLTGESCTANSDCPNPFSTTGNGICMSKVGTQCYSVTQNSCSSKTSAAGTCSVDGKACSISDPCAKITSNTCPTVNTCIGTTCSISTDTCSTVAPIVTCPAVPNANTCSSTTSTPGICVIDKQLCCTATGCPTNTTTNICNSTTSTPGTCSIDGLACCTATDCTTITPCAAANSNACSSTTSTSGTCAIDGKTCCTATGCTTQIPCNTTVITSCAQSGQCTLTGNSCTTNKPCPDSTSVPQCTLSTNNGANLAVLNTDLVCVPIDLANPQASQQICALRHAGQTECFVASPNTTDYFSCGITGGLACQANPDYPTENICLLGLDATNGPATLAITDPKYGCIALSKSSTANNPTACDNFGLANNVNVPGTVNQTAEAFLASEIANATASTQYIPSTDVDAFTAAWQAMQININITAASQSPYSVLNPNSSNTVIAPQLVDPIQCGIATGMTDDSAFNKMTVLCNSGPGLPTLINNVATAANFLNPVMYPEKTYNAANQAQNCANISAGNSHSSTNGSQCPFVYPNNSAYYYNTSSTCNIQDTCSSAGTCKISNQQPCLYQPTGTITCDRVTSGCVLNANTSTNTGTCYLAGVEQTGMSCCTSADCTCGNNYYCSGTTTGANPADQTCVPNGTCVGATASCSSSTPTGTCKDSSGSKSAGISCCFDSDCICAVQEQLCNGTTNEPASCQQIPPDDSASPYTWLQGSGATPGVYINCLLPVLDTDISLNISPEHPFGGPCPTSCQNPGTYCDSANSTTCSPNTSQAQACSAMGNCSVTTTQTCMKDSDCPSTETCAANSGQCNKSGAPCTSSTDCPIDNGIVQTCGGYCSINTKVACTPETAATDCPTAYIGIDPTNGTAGTMIMVGSCVGQPCSSPPGFGSSYDATTNPGGISDAGPNNTLCCNGTYCCSGSSCGTMQSKCVYNAPGIACPGLAGDPSDCIAADGTSATNANANGTVTCKTHSSGTCNCYDIICTDDSECTVQYTPQGSSAALTYTCLNSTCYNPSGNQGGGTCQPNGPSLANTTPNSSGDGVYDATYNAICSQIYHAGITLLPDYYNNDLTVAKRYAQAAVKLYRIANSNQAIITPTTYSAVDSSGLKVTCKLASGATGAGAECEPLNLYLGAAATTGLVSPSGNILNMAAYVAKLQTDIMTLLGSYTSPFDGAFTATTGYTNVVKSTTAACTNSVCTFSDGKTGAACTIDPSSPTKNPCAEAAIAALNLNANVGASYYLPLIGTELLQNAPAGAASGVPTVKITPGVAYLTVTPISGSFEYLPVNSPLRLGLLNVPNNVTPANVFLQENQCLNACCNVFPTSDPKYAICQQNQNDAYCSCTLFSNLMAPYDTIPLTATGTGLTLYEYFTSALSAVTSMAPSSYPTVSNWNENGTAIGNALTNLLADYQILAAIYTQVSTIGSIQPGSPCAQTPPISPIPPINGLALGMMIYQIVFGIASTAAFIKMGHPSVKKTPEEKLQEANDKIKNADTKLKNLEATYKSSPGRLNKWKAWSAKRDLASSVKARDEIEYNRFIADCEAKGLDPMETQLAEEATRTPGATTVRGGDTGPDPEQIADARADVQASLEELNAKDIFTASDLIGTDTNLTNNLIEALAKDLDITDDEMRKYLKEHGETDIDKVDWSDL